MKANLSEKRKMKFSMLSILTGCVLLVGCGGSDDNDATTGNNEQTGTPTQPTPVTASLVNEMSGIALREALLSGLVDTLIAGGDDVKDGMQCKTGTLTRTGNLFHFDQCSGLYEDGENAKVTGDIDISNNSYSYTNFVIAFPDGETQKINGSVKLSNSANVDTAEASKITLDSTEFNSAKKLISVNYTFTDYKLVWTPSDATHVQLQVSAKLKSTGREGGDFNMAFDNFNTPFNVQKDAEDELVG